MWPLQPSLLTGTGWSPESMPMSSMLHANLQWRQASPAGGPVEIVFLLAVGAPRRLYIRRHLCLAPIPAEEINAELYGFAGVNHLSPKSVLRSWSEFLTKSVYCKLHRSNLASCQLSVHTTSTHLHFGETELRCDMAIFLQHTCQVARIHIAGCSHYSYTNC